MSNTEKLYLASQSIPHPSTVPDQSGLEIFYRSTSNFLLQLHNFVAEARRNLEKCDLEDTRPVPLAKTLDFHWGSLLSPIRRLPPEIMSKILELAIPDKAIIVRPSFGRRAGDSIFPLTWVSSWWREIIVSQPSFWSSLIMRLAAEPVLDITHIILRACLARSGTTPLRLCLPFRSVELTPGLCRILDDLARHADKWKEFRSTLNLQSLDYVLKQARHFTDNPFSILETMDIMVGESYDDRFLGDSFIRCPRLYHLRLGFLRATDTIELAHLRTLETGCYHGSFAVLLDKRPLLESLTVHFVVGGASKGDAATPMIPIHVRHTHLRTLKVNIWKTLVADAWQSVQLPNLAFLQARDIDPGSFRDAAIQRFEDIKAMLSSSHCVLERVQLSGSLLEDSDTVASLFQGIRVRLESSSRFVGDNPYNPTTTKSGSS